MGLQPQGGDEPSYVHNPDLEWMSHRRGWLRVDVCGGRGAEGPELEMRRLERWGWGR